MAFSARAMRGAEISADIFGDVDSTDCPHEDPELAAAWHAGTETLRDWDGLADLSANPYTD